MTQDGTTGPGATGPGAGQDETRLIAPGTDGAGAADGSAPAMAAAVERLSPGTLADGDWHRLHPATPLLKGGVFLIVVLGWVLSNLRERLVEILIPEAGGDDGPRGDPIDWVLANHFIGWALAAVAVVLIVLVAAFWASWRMHTFRVTTEAVEVRKGIVFRSHRRAALDRVQGVNVTRSFLPRLFGAAKLQVSVAGQGASVELSYLGSAVTDGLRRDILILASGAKNERSAPSPATPAGPGGFVQARVEEFLAPELDPDTAPPESVVRVPPLRLAGSVVFSGATIWLLLLVAAIVVGAVLGTPWVLFSIIPSAIGFLAYYWSRFTKFLRYSIAGTAHGIRIGYGLLSTENETIPPGRIHGIEVRQPLVWRPFGWWEVRINKAVQAVSEASSTQPNAVVMPVGSRADVERVLPLLLPGLPADAAADLVERGLLGTGSDADYTTAPARSWIFNPLTWRRVGYALLGDVVVTRQGLLHRTLVVVPLARVQSVRIAQGPWQRSLALSSARVNTVSGPVSSSVSQLSRDDALVLFERVTASAVAAAAMDATQRWAARPE